MSQETPTSTLRKQNSASVSPILSLNFYSCGCTAYNVPIMSRCVEHNGYITAARDVEVTIDTRKSFVSHDKSLAVLNDTLIPAMRRLRDKSVGLIFSYPDQFVFGVRTHLSSSAFTALPDSFFPECDRILRDDGTIALIVEHFVLSSVVFCAHMAGFRISSVSTVRMAIKDEPLTSTFINEYSAYKACIVLRKRDAGHRPKVGDIKISSAQNVLPDLYCGNGMILDTSCIHYPFIFTARRVAKTIGIVGSVKRYLALKQRAESMEKNKWESK